MTELRPGVRIVTGRGEPATDTHDSGSKLGALGLVLSLFAGPVGTVVSAVALVKSKRRGIVDPAATAGVSLGIITTLVFLVALWFIVQFFAGTIGPCAELGPGTHETGLVTYECGEP